MTSSFPDANTESGAQVMNVLFRQTNGTATLQDKICRRTASRGCVGRSAIVDRSAIAYRSTG
jgi:hypothetical protein